MKPCVPPNCLGIVNFAFGSVLLCLFLPNFIRAELTPPYFNLATGRKIYSTATCGVDSDGPELYCKLVGANTEHDSQYFSVIQGQVCDVCDPSRVDKSHPPEYAIDGKESWWQSPPLSRGMKYNEVNLTIDFGQEFHVAYLYIRMGNSPRPGLWTLEKSSDYGETWTPWMHFSDTAADCETYFGKNSLRPITNDNDVICTTEYSKIVPLENGEIPVMLLNDRPSAKNYFNSTVLQEWTRATNVRIRLLRTKNLLGHLMSVVSKDPSVTRRYFYSIKDISIGGRCMCNGHADTCDVLDPRSSRRLLACLCQHHTCGIQCNECCPGFEQKKWSQNTKARPFQCEPCNCFGHSSRCIYDENVDRNRSSLDIHGKYEGGGICQDCQHNTEGINCNKCKGKFYRPYGKHWNETDVCSSCNCEFFYSTGNCEEETGRCECRVEFQPPNCDECAYGYFGYPNCKECECNLNGTIGYHCATTDGSCPCKENFAGHYCKECADGFYGYPECQACECNVIGSVSNKCDSVKGNCTCLGNFGGNKCERCKHGYYSYPSCLYCDCDIQGTESDICGKGSGKCLCREGYGGPRCDQCLPGYYNYPNCVPCNCSSLGSTSTTCDVSGKCSCLRNFAGKQCTSCSAGYYSYPECLPCNCDSHGSEGISCNSDGQCSCFVNFDGKKCDACKEGFYNFPSCEDCNCDPAGVIAKFAGCGSVPAGELCQCKKRVTGRICDQCEPLYWNLNISNPDGCEVCDCFLDGTIGSLDTCDSKTGQCACKPSVGSRQCKECKDGTFDLFSGSLFGCKDCACDIGGSRNPVCDKLNGQCSCHPRISGRGCTHPLTTHYFPTLYQFQFEYEDGYTPSGAFVRYQFDENQFPGFSRKGYAVFSNIQNEVTNEVTIFKSSVYRMVIRYVNPTKENITASILITSDNPDELDQRTKVFFKTTTVPEFVTVSGSKGQIPSAIVLDPDRYTITIKTDKNVLLDYFVLLPAAYYEASILSRRIENPCELGNLQLCRHYNYPSVSEFVPEFDGFVREGDMLYPANEIYDDSEHLAILNISLNTVENLPMITDTQKSLLYKVTVPHTGRYVVVIDYLTDRTKPETYMLQVRKEGDEKYGFVTMYPCLYTMACRQPVTDSESREKLFFLDTTDPRAIEIYHENDDYGRVAIASVTAIPVEQWSIDFIKPKPVCVIKDGVCIKSSYRTVPDSKKIEFHSKHEDRISDFLPPNILDKTITLIRLDKNNATIEVKGKAIRPGQYVILVKYFQPNHPQYSVLYRLETPKQNYDGKFDVEHCPSNIGCRALITPHNAWFDIDDEFSFTLTNPRSKDIWVDYMLVVPVEENSDNLLEEEKFDQTKEFIQKCGHNHFHIKLNTTVFCRNAVFSLTADYNDGALPCNCNYAGSTSFECDPFGGQCACKSNVIGRQCESCRTGFYGFPDCKHCDCPLTALCEKDTGECICPPHVTGDKCDKCEPYTYGFHQIIGCEECKCNSLGVHDNNLQCDMNNGSCSCRPNIEGRTCDTCVNGFFNFPHCQPCRCNIPGTTFEICDKENEACFCKKNVVGEHCERCADGTYNLQTSNPEGCTKCFCFGKTTRCERAYLRVFNVSILKNTTINTISIDKGAADFEQWNVPEEEIMVNETTLQVDFSYRTNDNGLIYAGMLNYLGNQNNHLTSYGGVLAYTLYYTTGPFGSAVHGPDIIMHSKDSILLHRNYEQPANAQIFRGTVRMLESNFQTIDNRPVSRDEFMMALRNLYAIYIRASYWEQSVVTQISDVFLSVADEDDNYNLYEQLSVEKCYCPPGYAGLSCEDCAAGYYRDPDGPYGGYCIPCQCNGHADTCDCQTGICQNCKHFTTGEHCEKCIIGYHGNATLGTHNDCMICACPLPYESNNFATSCEISETGTEIHCECGEGYTGPRCESCASGFYGQPEKKDDFCKSCDCSGNINPDEPGACDTVTGECLKCLNNTHGRACNLCAPGYYGDAVKLKDCKSCDCEMLGTHYCDSFIGTCNCHANVIGERCDRCEEDHYGYDSGIGCKTCDCGIASNSSQCDMHSGECACKPGVSGRQCDRCAADHWNYSADGCIPCSCNKGYSLGIGCNTQNGQCECLPGVIGDKCDACPYRWVLIKEEGCSSCDVCIHALLNITDVLKNQLDPVFEDFKAVALSYFTAQKLNYINELADKIEPEVKALDPKGVNLTPAREDIESLEMDVKSLNQQIGITSTSAKECLDSGNKLITNAQDFLDESRLISTNTLNTIKEVENFENSFNTAASTKAENALTEVKIIFDELVKSVEEYESNNSKQLKDSQNILDQTQLAVLPVTRQKEALVILRGDIDNFNEKLENLHGWSIVTNLKCNEIVQLNEKNKESFANSKFGIVANQTLEVNNNVGNAGKLIINGDLTLNAIDRNLAIMRYGLDELKESNKKVDELLPKIEEDYSNIGSIVEEGEQHLKNISNLALDITEQYSNITSTSEEAIKASTAYSDIVQAVLDAQKALKNAKYAAGNATELSGGVRERAGKADKTAREFLEKARNSLRVVQSELDPHLNKSASAVAVIDVLNKKSDEKLKKINLALEELPKHLKTKEWETANDQAISARENSKMALRILGPIINEIPLGLELAKQTPKDIDTSTKDIGQTTHQVDKVEALVPRLAALVNRMDIKQAQTSLIGSDLGDRIDKLKKKIEMARNIANGIGVGVTFHPNTVLELKPPESLSRLATNSKISAYFNTTKPNGFLFYLGNENKTGNRPKRGQDFMAVEIENGYPVLTVDLGNGPEKIISDKYVADGKWYQAIVDRTGNHVKFTIREQLDSGGEELHATEQILPGTFSVFDVDENSKLYVGGYSADFAAPEDLRYSSFEGQIENLRIGDENVGLWNFVDGGENMEGAMERDRLITQEAPVTGYRFNGNGYVLLDAKPHHFKTRSTIHFRFKASKDAKEGLLFYAGQGEHYISVELKEGSIYFQYKLGEHKVTIGTNTTLNDDQWHRVEAERDGRRGVLKVDGNDIYQEESLQGSEENLLISDEMYFGGHPGKNIHSDVIGKGFDGCIDEVSISGTPVDLSRNLKAYGVRPGCPEKFSTSLSYRPGQFGYLRHGNVSADNSFHLNLKFQTRQDEGVIFFASNGDGREGIGLVIMKGDLILRSMNQDISTNGTQYNDGQWHVVSVTHHDKNLILTIDDAHDFRIEVETPLSIQSGDIYFGGLPAKHRIPKNALSTLAYFVGCISDVTLNGNIVNFASALEKSGGNIDGCPVDILDYDLSSVAIYYPGDTLKDHEEETHDKHVVDKSNAAVDTKEDVEDNTIAGADTPDNWALTEKPVTIDQITKRPGVQTTTLTTPTKRPTRRRQDFGIKQEPMCKLPVNPSLDDIDEVKAGYRFGTTVNSRIEIKQIPSKMKKGFEISLQFKTDSYEGLLFYAADAGHTDFVGLYLKRGKVHYTLRIAQHWLNISSAYHYNDNKWHDVTIIRQQLKAELIIDTDDVAADELPTSSRNTMAVQAPFYIGDVDSDKSDDLNLNLAFEKGSHYSGCIREISIQNRNVPVASFNTVGVIPCSDEVEKGIYFNKGFVKLRERFNVGAEFTVSFDIKPRTTTGMLLSVHGRNAYLILQMINGTINFTVDNGEGPIVATFKPNPGENLCDGNWRTVEAIKSQYVITLIVNSVSSQPAIGNAAHPLTETTRPLFLGGHPHILKVRGLTARKPFIGCIRNFKIKDQLETIHPEMTVGDVRTGVCPTN